VQVILDFIKSNLTYEVLDSGANEGISNSDRFRCEFFMERIIDVLENTPTNKQFLKDALLESGVVYNMCIFLKGEALLEGADEQKVYQRKNANKIVFRLLTGQMKNHPAS